ncbi:patatin-like phospholipase family protein [Sunxiuqinia sp. sy24]|uniref:patatin-like phospholipase family protein n=1 Tax=Sunxiuqinia sp. sy24 TaxID=3461495 RepID=UPI00404661C2
MMKTKIGISLSGGGARGIAHIGVLAALEKYGIHPELISGTSMGALVGVLYASGLKPEAILELINASKIHQIISWAFPAGGLLDLDKVEHLLRTNIPEDDFSALNKKFYCAVTNLNTGKFELISKGKLIDYVLASASIPIVFEPRIIRGQTYVDGGLLNNLPVEPLVDQADIIIGVHVNHNEELKEVSGIKAIAERSFRLAITKNANEKFGLCDFVIDPPKIRKYSTFDFSKANEIYAIGFEETENRILDFFEQLDLNKVMEEKKKRLTGK